MRLPAGHSDWFFHRSPTHSLHCSTKWTTQGFLRKPQFFFCKWMPTLFSLSRSFSPGQFKFRNFSSTCHIYLKFFLPCDDPAPTLRKVFGVVGFLYNWKFVPSDTSLLPLPATTYTHILHLWKQQIWFLFLGVCLVLFCLFVVFLDSTYTWDHAIFVFICLTFNLP